MPDADEPSRRRAAAMAGHTDDHETAEAAILDSAARVRIAGLRSLDRLRRLDDGRLEAALADDDPRVRCAALELAAPRPTPAIEQLLTDPDAGVVETAAWALGERPDPGPATLEGLIEVARRHTDPLAREAAVAALGALGHPRGLPAILDATGDKPAIRRRAVVALAAFEGPEVDAAWTRARRDPDRQVRDAVDDLAGPDDVDATGLPSGDGSRSP